MVLCEFRFGSEFLFWIWVWLDLVLCEVDLELCEVGFNAEWGRICSRVKLDLVLGEVRFGAE